MNKKTFYSVTASKSAGHHALPLPPQSRNTQFEDIADAEELRRLDAGKQIALPPISVSSDCCWNLKPNPLLSPLNVLVNLVFSLVLIVIVGVNQSNVTTCMKSPVIKLIKSAHKNVTRKTRSNSLECQNHNDRANFMDIRNHVLQHVSCLEAESYALVSQLQLFVDSPFCQVHIV